MSAPTKDELSNVCVMRFCIGTKSIRSFLAITRITLQPILKTLLSKLKSIKSLFRVRLPKINSFTSNCAGVAQLD